MEEFVEYKEVIDEDNKGIEQFNDLHKEGWQLVKIFAKPQESSRSQPIHDPTTGTYLAYKDVACTVWYTAYVFGRDQLASDLYKKE